MRTIALLAAALASGCADVRFTKPPPPNPAAPPRAAATAAGAGSASRPPAAAQAPAGACRISGRVARGSVEWLLRTRPDAVATLELTEGYVTAELRASDRAGHDPTAFVEVKNERMLLRALVVASDLTVLLTKPVVGLPGHYLDGVTRRPLFQLVDGTAWLDARIESAVSTSVEVSCSELGLMPSDNGIEKVLPPARGEVYLKRAAIVKVADHEFPIGFSCIPCGTEGVPGALAVLRGDDTSPTSRLVSVATCGGTLLGWVPKSDILGPAKLRHGSNARCPNTSRGVYAAPRSLTRPEQCSKPLDVFLRSATLEDAVGVLAPGAAFEVDGAERGGTVLVSIESPPAVPLQGASFSVRASDLATCRASR